MPNWITTSIEIKGQKEVLEKIYDAIEKCNDLPECLDNGSSNNWVGNIFNLLGINTKKYAEDRAFWSRPRFNKYGHLVFIEQSAWERSRCAETLKLKFYQEISGINYELC